jgi:cytidine deaminase
MSGNRKDRFKTLLRTFPDSAQSLLQHLPEQGGKLSRKTCNKLMRWLDIPMEALMIRLLPLAKVFSTAPISEFHVGAVALAGKGPDETAMNLYLGANMEFKHLVLNMALHAEQAAVMNAWHQGADRLNAIATSEPPCGHCRQFLHELADPTEVIVLRPAGEGDVYQRNRLSELLPGAIAPCNLGNDACLMAPPPAIRKLKLARPLDDPVVQAALSAAAASYAPYTGNLAGSAVQTPNNEIVSGRYMESVAFNPSISPFHSAILRMNLMMLEEKKCISRVVLVEKPTRVRQKDFAEMLIRAWMPGIELEYHIAEEEER